MAWRSRIRRIRRELPVWGLGLLIALVGHGAATSVLEHAEGKHAAGLWVWISVFGALTLLFYGLFANPYPHRLTPRLKLRVVLFGAVSWLMASAGVITLYGVAAGIHGFVSGAHVDSGTFWRYVIWFAILTVAFVYIRDEILVIHVRHLRSERLDEAQQLLLKELGLTESRGRRCVIGILSSVSEDLADNNAYLPQSVQWSDPPILEDDLQELKASKERDVPPWQWEMLLRALRPHAHRLTNLVLVCSQNASDRFPASLPQAPAFAKLLKKYPEFQSVRISVFGEKDGVRSAFPAESIDESVRGFDFGNLDEMSSAIADLLKFLLFGGLGKRIRPSDIMIDFTGGTKPVSVVAAAATFRGDIAAQYVDTGDLAPTTYDLVANPEAPKA